MAIVHVGRATTHAAAQAAARAVARRARRVARGADTRWGVILANRARGDALPIHQKRLDPVPFARDADRRLGLIAHLAVEVAARHTLSRCDAAIVDKDCILPRLAVVVEHTPAAHTSCAYALRAVAGDKGREGRRVAAFRIPRPIAELTGRMALFARAAG